MKHKQNKTKTGFHIIRLIISEMIITGLFLIIVPIFGVIATIVTVIIGSYIIKVLAKIVNGVHGNSLPNIAVYTFINKPNKNY
jgi:hypothetical protein